MVAAVTQIQWFGGSPTEPVGVSAQDAIGLIFNREDSRTGTAISAGVPIPSAASTLYSWPKLLALAVMQTGTTTISNRRLSLAGPMPTGMHMYVRGLSAYVQPQPLIDNLINDATPPTEPAPVVAPGLIDNVGGGALSAQTLWVQVTYVGLGGGETTGSPIVSRAVALNDSLTIASPPADAGAAGWYAYVGVGATQPPATAMYRQQGTPTPLGTALTLTADPTNVGLTVPLLNTAAAFIEALPTNTPVFDASGVSSASTGRNGGFCQLVAGIDSQYASSGIGAGTIPLPNYRFVYDEA